MRHGRVLVAALGLLMVLTACSSEPQGDNVDPEQVDSTEIPELGACRVLTPADVGCAATPPDGRLRRRAHRRDLRGRRSARRLHDVDYDVRELGHSRTGPARAVQELPRRRREPGAAHHPQLGVVPAVGGGWDDGARWYRCDGSVAASRAAVRRPAATAKGLLLGDPGPLAGLRQRRLVSGAEVPCTQPHTGARSRRSSSASPRTSTPATGSSRCAPGTSAPTRSRPG